MTIELFKWDIYEITAQEPIHGVMLRGRLRKLFLEQNRNLLAENAKDTENVVRVAVPHDEDIELLRDYLKKIIPNSTVKLILTNTKNPVLSKLKVNREERYAL
ncbi:MAG: hypothetical protein ACMXYE_04825 [Candidatus Woesearchaeota archaeon]